MPTFQPLPHVLEQACPHEPEDGRIFMMSDEIVTLSPNFTPTQPFTSCPTSDTFPAPVRATPVMLSSSSRMFATSQTVPSAPSCVATVVLFVQLAARRRPASEAKTARARICGAFLHIRWPFASGRSLAVAAQEIRPHDHGGGEEVS